LKSAWLLKPPLQRTETGGLRLAPFQAAKVAKSGGCAGRKPKIRRCRAAFSPKRRSFAPFIQKLAHIMGVTRLKRKDRVNKAVANNRVAEIKRLQQKPVIKNVDVEAIKAEFAAKAEQA
jgi:hypothetical protein